jgi:uncharacterized ion transporter superfamily protein YfcC
VHLLSYYIQNISNHFRVTVISGAVADGTAATDHRESLVSTAAANLSVALYIGISWNVCFCNCCYK